METTRVVPDYRNPSRIALWTHLPWNGGRVLLRLPEALSSRSGHFFCEWQRENAWPVSGPLALPEWRSEENRPGIGYECELRNGVRFYVRVKPGKDELDMVLGVKNGTSSTLEQVSANMCVVLSDAPEFCDRTLARTYFLFGGKPRLLSSTTPEPAAQKRPPWIHCQVRGIRPLTVPDDCPWWVCRERADDGLIFTESAESRRFVALIWGRASSIVANSRTPCVHSNPLLGDCEPGAVVEQAGRLLLHEGNVDLLCFRALDGFA